MKNNNWELVNAFFDEHDLGDHHIKSYNDLQTDEEREQFQNEHPELQEILSIVSWIDKNNTKISNGVRKSQMEFLTPLLLKLMPLTTKEVCPFIYIIDTIKTKINIIISKSYSFKGTIKYFV